MQVEEIGHIAGLVWACELSNVFIMGTLEVLVKSSE